MHLQRIRSQNFRAFGDGKTCPQLDWELAPGLNILIGENDAGKTSIIDANGPEIGSAVRELVRATYLRPLRDAEAELKPGRQSRLSQILGAHRSIQGQEENDFDATDADKTPQNLVGLMAFTQHHLGKHPVIKGVEDDINQNYLGKFAFAGDTLESRIQIASEVIPIPVACLTDRDVVPDTAAKYIKKPENGKKRFESDYSPSDLQDVVHGKVKRAEGGNTIVCVSDHWTFEYDLARYGCAELMFVAIQLAIKAEAKGESLDACPRRPKYSRP